MTQNEYNQRYCEAKPLSDGNPVIKRSTVKLLVVDEDKDRHSYRKIDSSHSDCNRSQGAIEMIQDFAIHGSTIKIC